MSRAIAGTINAAQGSDFNNKVGQDGRPSGHLSGHSNAFLLVTHGSRDPRSGQGAIALAQALQRKCPPATALGTAALELGPAPLHRQILDFARQSRLAPGGCLYLFPLFLLPGVHVMEDIPEEVEAAHKALAQDPQLCQIQLRLLPYLGQHQQAMAQLLAPYPSASSSQPAAQIFAQILMAHGSRRSGANPHIEALGDRLNLPVAYWVQPDSLIEQVQALLQHNIGTILGASSADPSFSLTLEVIPYFLFEGGITDAIAQRLQELENQLRPEFPQLHLTLGPTLHQRSGFAELVQRQLRQASFLDSN